MALQPPAEDAQITTEGIADRIAQDTEFFINVKQRAIVVTEDKLRLCLIKNRRVLSSRRAWLTPLGLTATITLAMVTTGFRDALGLSADAWHAFFVLLFVVSAVWLLFAGKAAWTGRRVDLDSVVGELMQASGIQATSGSSNQERPNNRL